jgi:alpha-tubulin suppressor-like RCC1 family protein
MEGDIECWGWGEYGQLGNGADRNTSSPKMVLISLVDRAPVVEKTGYPAVGQTITAEVNIWEPISWRLGHTYTWFDSTGIRSFESNSTVISDQDFAKWIGVHVQISDNGGELFGEISLGLRSVSDWPVVDLESDSPAISAFQIDAGSAHTCSVAAWGELSCWGDGSFGQTGTGYLGDDGLDAPAMVTPPQQALGVSSGGAHSCYVSISGGLYCWGHNGSGQLGDETNQDSSVPVSVTRFEYDWIAVAAGGSHTCGLDVEGNVFCWGDNAHGQLGIGGTTNSSYPRYVNLPGPAKSISIGGHHSCATLESLIYCWGRNNYGQLGNGSTISSQLPVQVTLVTDDATLSLGYAHSCAVTSGDIYCWGSNESGQLGREGVSSSSPEQVVGVVEARQVSAGSTYSCAIQVSGEVLCWGNNSSGQLGTGGTSNASIPVRADIAERAIFVTGYDTHTCASLYDGAVQCWGGNAVGQLGTGNRVDYLVPELSQMPTFEFEDLHPRLVGSAQLGETIQVDIVDGPWFVRELQKDLTTNHWIASKSLSVLRNLTIEDSLSSSPSLVLDGMLAGKRIAAFVEITVPGFDTQVLRTNYIYLPFGYLTLIGEPSISGETETGATLTLNPGNWDEGVTFSAEWVSGAMPVADSDGLEYVLSDRDADKRIWAVVTASKVGYHPVTVSTFETASVELVQPLAQASAPTIRGTTRVGATATVRNGSWDPGVNFSYQWLRNGQRISGANQGTYVFQPEDLNQAISLELVGKKPGFRTTRRDSAPVSVSIGLLAKTPIPQIAGDTSIGSTLTANPGVWDEGVTFEYQWLRSNRAITGATDSAYSLTSLDKGAKISVRVLGSKTGFTSVTKTSPQTGLVASAFVVSPTPQISGIVEVGKVLKVVAGTWNPKPKLTYKWLCNGATIRGATKSTFKLASLQLGCEISVAVTASKAGYAATTRTSAAVLVLRKKNWL